MRNYTRDPKTGKFIKKSVSTSAKLAVVDTSFDDPVVKASTLRPNKYFVQVGLDKFMPLNQWEGVKTVAKRNMASLGQVIVVKAGITKALYLA